MRPVLLVATPIHLRVKPTLPRVPKVAIVTFFAHPPNPGAGIGFRPIAHHMSPIRICPAERRAVRL